MKICYIPVITLAMILSGCNKTYIQKEFIKINLINDDNKTIKNEIIDRKTTLLKINDNKVNYLPITYIKKSNNIIKERVIINKTYTNFPLSERTISNNYFDIIKPLYDNQKYLLFSQLGVRRSDRRTIVNLGIGQRYFHKDWLLGYNFFCDVQTSSNHHQSLGIGGEFRHKLLYLAINSHYGITGWHSSLNNEDCEEHVAHGYDIRAQGWLPVYPKLSGKIQFEQFFAKTSACYHTIENQKKLFKLTLGAEYRPVPLLTFSINNIFNHVGHKDTRFGMYISYKLGIPLSRQVSSAELITINKPNNNRYRLVERNNEIIRNFRQKKQDKIRYSNRIISVSNRREIIFLTYQGSFCLKKLQFNNKSLHLCGDKTVLLATKNYITNILSCNSQLANYIALFANIYDKSSNNLNNDITIIIIQNLILPLSGITSNNSAELVTYKNNQKENISMQIYDDIFSSRDLLSRGSMLPLISPYHIYFPFSSLRDDNLAFIDTLIKSKIYRKINFYDHSNTIRFDHKNNISLFSLKNTEHILNNVMHLRTIDRKNTTLSMINEKRDFNDPLSNKINIKLIANKMKMSRKNKNLDEELRENRLKLKTNDNDKPRNIAEILSRTFNVIEDRISPDKEIKQNISSEEDISENEWEESTILLNNKQEDNLGISKNKNSLLSEIADGVIHLESSDNILSSIPINKESNANILIFSQVEKKKPFVINKYIDNKLETAPSKENTGDIVLNMAERMLLRRKLMNNQSLHFEDDTTSESEISDIE